MHAWTNAYDCSNAPALAFQHMSRVVKLKYAINMSNLTYT